MHAVLVRVNIDDEERSVKELREELVPQISQVPGFVAGYWTRKDNTGVSLVVFESEEAAQNASERVRDSAPTGVTIQDIEVREVVANA
jgi:heme-degrading monooxygenase HmoA